MNNIREILLLQNNYKQKIIKISGKCEKGDEHMMFQRNNMPINKYFFGVCKNCNNIMYNSCKGNKYCALCINLDREQITCENGCNKTITNIEFRICHRCDKILFVIWHGIYITHFPSCNRYFIGGYDDVYCGKCWSNRR